MDYFEKNALFPPLIGALPEAGLSLVVTIPCHDEPDLLRTLDSLAACALPKRPAAVIVAINSAENAPVEIKQHNAATYTRAIDWAERNNRLGLSFHILHFPDLRPKHAGVGLARKIAMDEAARRLVAAGRPKGVIACLDADSRVQQNYLQALELFFEQHPACPAAGIYYEHPLEGDEFAPEIYAAITRYELHLRYYVHALRRAGLPTATQTVGSAMAVRADAYQAQGGMNRRQAGEDFYFLHKFTPLGGFGEITSTTVIPSPRPSHRVPFGTGKAVGEMLAGNTFLTYSPMSFVFMNMLFNYIDGWFELCEYYLKRGTPNDSAALDRTLFAIPLVLSSFLKKENFSEKLRELYAHSSGSEAFRKRFFRWFDAFRAMKFVHHVRDHFYPDVPVEEAVLEFMRSAGWTVRQTSIGARELLEEFRAMDKLGNWGIGI